MRQGPRSCTLAAAVLLTLVAGCSNNPYRPDESAGQTYFYAYNTPPSKLDPTSAYYTHEGRIIDQIYEPPFTYHYLKRPYQLICLTAEEIPEAVYYGKDDAVLTDPDPPPSAVARAEYTIRIKKGILYQNHPCFARGADGKPLYHNVSLSEIAGCDYPSDFPVQDTRELKAKDYALQIRRLADPRLASPVFSTIATYIAGLDKLNETYKAMLEQERARRKSDAGAGYNQQGDEKANPILLDYMGPECEGVQVIDDNTFRITLKRKYPQILYWMCMHFFGPIPQEAVEFYTQPAMAEKQFSINRCPIGTGPYFIEKYKPNEVIVMARNPNYHDDFFPTEGMPGDREAGLLDDAGKRVPFITRQVRRLEKEAIPEWNKFLQGYYDDSSISGEVFDQAIRMRGGNEPVLTDDMRRKGIALQTAVGTMFWYTAFNMLDDVVGGYDEKRCKLRQAVSIALDYNEYLDIFFNGRGVLAQGPLPPGIFGYQPGEKGTNPFVDQWDPNRERHVRQPIEKARKLMEEAGYPGGIGPDGEPLTLHWDHSAQGESFFRARFDWTARRLKLIGVRLKDRGTDLSRYRQKKKQGNWQLASGGWLADYPDPENFLFLFYGPNGKVKSGGPNAVNYENPKFDALFEQMESMQNSPERQAIIDKAMRALQYDAPAVWQFHPISYGLQHAWYHNMKPHQMSYNVMRYRRLEPERRVRLQNEWNRPRWQVPVTLLALLFLAVVPAAAKQYRQERGGTETGN